MLFGSSNKVFDIFYDLDNDMLIAAIGEDDDSKIIYVSEISGSNPISKYDIIIS